MTYKTRTIQHGHFTINVHRPVLAAHETAKREQQALAVLESTMKTYILKKENKTQ